ncbi:NAD-dependent epimerase/dehydratase family protein [Shimia biformata]|uniref:NAD-dependent epimerase/dehydratase family protein n=1 Tax=Shimia biformata TaxID=1294299 RepID=UPI0019514EC8|nr:NAD-dependent epimerase/dehydratase family protein [Shimia biformata]
MTIQTRTALVTGSSGFIGFFTAKALLDAGWRVIGLDCLSDYYDVALKERRRTMLLQNEGFRDVTARLEDPGLLMRLFEEHQPDVVIHLAAQAGVRFSIEAPRSYLESNLIGTFELLEAARAFPPRHLLMASTSSVYGANSEMPYAETHQTDHQMSFYAATKKANEAMAHSYAHLYHLPITMFRFFTVYGPWGRPDMAPYLFTSAILKGEPIKVFNFGDMQRDFTFVDDLVAGIVALIHAVPPQPGDRSEPAPAFDSLSPVAPWRVVNIGNGEPVPLLEFIAAIETATGLSAQKDLMPMQPGDVEATWAEARLLEHLTGVRPQTSVQNGMSAYVTWFRDYYGM